MVSLELSTAALVRLMKATPAMESVAQQALRELADLGRMRNYRRNTYIFHQGDESSEVFLLCEGRVEIDSISTSGHRQWHTTLEAPQLFGELAALGELPRAGGALAIEDSLLWQVAGGVFVDFVGKQPSASRSLIRALARQIETYGALVDDLLFLDLKGRVAKRLLGLVAPSFDELPPDGAVVPSVVTHADLASLAGGTRENVTRILSDFQRRGILSRDGRRYVLKDIQALKRLASL